MKCAVMQPTYFPWAGYFALINTADVFMFYDDAQFSKSSWHYRNRILCSSEIKWLSLAIKHKNGQKINETKFIKLEKCKKKHVNTLQTYYGKTPYFNDVKDILDFLMLKQCNDLADYNIDLIKYISSQLALDTKFVKSSDFKVSGERSEKLSAYLSILQCKHYLSPVGAKEYLQQDNLIEKNHPVSYCDFTPMSYPQNGNKGEFITHLSILDTIANLGWKKTSNYIRNMSCQIPNIN